MAAQAVLVWESVQSRLAPIIGESGFRVVFARSLHRARGEHPWLAREPAAGDAPFAMLKASMETQPAERAAQGNRVLTEHFHTLLIALIGKDLMTRLLSPA